jgi:integrase
VVVALVPAAVDILKRRQAARGSGEWVFPSWGSTGHIVSPKAAWRRVLARAGISNLRVDDLRRTLGSWQAAQGTSLPIIGKSLGHKSTAATAIYARIDLDPVRAAVTAATDAILKAGEKPVTQPEDGTRGEKD